MSRFARFIADVAGVYRLTIAQNHMSKSRYAEALDILLGNQFQNGQLTEALIMAGNCSYYQKDFIKSVTFYERAVQNEIGSMNRKSTADSKYLVAYASLYIAAAEMRLGLSYSQDEIDQMKVTLRAMDCSKTIKRAFSV